MKLNYQVESTNSKRLILTGCPVIISCFSGSWWRINSTNLNTKLPLTILHPPANALISLGPCSCYVWSFYRLSCEQTNRWKKHIKTDSSPSVVPVSCRPISCKRQGLFTSKEPISEEKVLVSGKCCFCRKGYLFESSTLKQHLDTLPQVCRESQAVMQPVHPAA